jgi:ribosomal protein L11 methyltransferase
VTAVWFEITVVVPQDYGEAVANFLIENGAPGLQSEERGEATALTAYFSNEPPVESLRRFCADLGCVLPGSTTVSIGVQKVADENWAENWKTHFQPQLIGDRLYICPPWNAAAPPGRVAVVIDPGMAFGTGHHASTRGCLLRLERATREQRITRALDVGTGSGVLAIALAKLGVTEVWAIDTDPNACAIATANARLNDVSACIHVRASLDEAPGTFDLVTANLYANALQELAPRLTHVLRPGGILICAGLLTDDEERVRTAYAACGVQLDTRDEEPPWVTLALRGETQP